ncbi:MAG: glutamate cyclase domain-containing protein [Phycisphaerae bacterium]
MNPRITSIENLIASDPGGRNIFGLMLADQLRLAAQSLRLARRVAIVSGFYVPEAGAGETDGPPGAKVLGEALKQLGIEVDYLTDELNAPLFRALGIEPILDVAGYLDHAQPTHLVSIERVGRGVDGRYRNMRGVDVTAVTAPLDELFIDGSRRGLTTIGIGDGGNEIGMGKVFADLHAASFNPRGAPHGLKPAACCVVATDFCIAAGVSNWGAYGLAGALSVLHGRDLLPSAESVARDLERIVRKGGAVDGVTHRHKPTCDGLDLSASLRMLESIRRQLAPSPLERGEPLLVGIVGYGETGRAAAALLAHHGHRVCISDEGPVTLETGMLAAGVEAGGHSIDFLSDCDLVVASPGVRGDSPILSALHRRGIPVMSELELAYQLSTYGGAPFPGPLIAVTGTIGKRTTVELLQRLFNRAGRSMTIGGNRGLPLSALLLDDHPTDAIAVAVSSFQLETVVSFRPAIAILLNIDEAHLDRHRSIAEYVRIKSRIFMNHRPDDALILPFDDQRVRTLARKHQGRTFFVSSRQSVDRGAWCVDGVVRLNVEGRVEEIGPADPPFPENLLASVLAARLCGLSTEQIARAIQQ